MDGLVELDSIGPYLFVTDPDGVVRTGDPGATRPASAEPSVAAASSATGAGVATVDSGPPSGGPAAAGRFGGSGSNEAGVGPLEAIGLLLLGAAITLALAVPLIRRAACSTGRTASPALAAPDPGIDAS